MISPIIELAPVGAGNTPGAATSSRHSGRRGLCIWSHTPVAVG